MSDAHSREPVAHGYLQTARGMCTDEAPYGEIDAMIAKAVDAVKDIEDAIATRDRRLEAYKHEKLRLSQRVSVLEAAIDDYSMWEPGRRGHAAAHRRLMEVRRA